MCGRAHGHFRHSRHSGQSDLPEESPGETDRIPPKKEKGIAAMVLLLLIKGYRYGISPLFPPSCRYVPTCSEYAVEAIARYGALRGGWLSLCRLLRCHPFAAGGYDPVK